MQLSIGRTLSLSAYFTRYELHTTESVLWIDSKVMGPDVQGDICMGNGVYATTYACGYHVVTRHLTGLPYVHVASLVSATTVIS